MKHLITPHAGSNPYKGLISSNVSTRLNQPTHSWHGSKDAPSLSALSYLPLPPPHLSFIFLCLLPPLFFLGSASGTGNGLGCLAGGGSCHFSILRLTSSLSARPWAPLWSPPGKSEHQGGGEEGRGELQVQGTPQLASTAAGGGEDEGAGEGKGGEGKGREDVTDG